MSGDISAETSRTSASYTSPVLPKEYADEIESLLADVAAYARKLIADDDLRAEELENAARWTAGKPKELISEYKMFGD